MYYGRLDRDGTLKHSPVSVKRLLYSESMLPGPPTHAQPGKTIHMERMDMHLRRIELKIVNYFENVCALHN